MPFSNGDTFAGCRIISRCGHGSYGVVYLAEDAVGRRVALKIFDSPETGERELRGVRNYMRLPSTSDSLIAIHHTGIENGVFYYIMDLADNASTVPDVYVPDTLAERLKKSQRIPLIDAVNLCLSILDGLEIMHKAELLHRDIKPENILFINGHPKLGDPGLAGDYTHTLSIAGTLGYIPPELLHSQAKQTTACDIYALGKVLYSAVTGNAPEQFPAMPYEVGIQTFVKICNPLARLCNALPEKRCQNCAECREILLGILSEHGKIWYAWRRFQADVRWRRKILTAVIGVFALLTIFSGAVMLYSTHEHTQKRIVQQQLHDIRAHQGMLLVQLGQLGEEISLKERLDDIEDMIAQKRPSKATAALASLEKELAVIAKKHCPPPAQDGVTTSERLLVNAKAFGYLASPLGKYHLGDNDRLLLETKAREEAALLGGNGNAQQPSVYPTVRNGNDLIVSRGINARLKYIPPGVFNSTTTGKVERIDYPFWMLESELSFEQFESFVRLPSSGKLELPASKIGWNDMLAFCMAFTKNVRKDIDLPSGYAFRPPTEAEWEFAAKGGMSGLSPASEEQQSHKPIPLPLKDTTNFMGLYNMDRNLSEAVIPYPEYQPPNGWTVIRGSNFSEKYTGINTRTPFRLDQITLETVGFRPVLAPVEPTFFAKHWFFSMPLRTCKVNGKTYVGIDACHSTSTWNSTSQIAKAFGGHLPEPASKQEWHSVCEALELDERFPSPLDIVFKDNAWRSVTDGTPSPFASELPAPSPESERRCLSALTRNGGALLPVSANSYLPSIVIEYQDEASFADRRQPQCSETFEIDGRCFGLLPFRLPASMHRAFIEFAGYREPSLNDSLLEKVVKRLAESQKTVALGCHLHSDGWRWSDGAKFEPTCELEDFGGKAKNISQNYKILIASQGLLKQSASSEALLVEIPTK